MKTNFKKKLCLILAIVLCLSIGQVTFAGNGVLDDVIIGQEIEITDFGIVSFTSFKFADTVPATTGTKKSGEEKEYATLKFDITNTQKIIKRFSGK